MSSKDVLTKVPAVTLTFWIIKILATTLGETGGDTLSMTMNLGYLVSTAIFATALVIFIIVQVAAKKFHPLLYWATIVASTTAGTTLADFATRSIGIGYVGGSLLLLGLVLASLAAWHWSEGTVSVQTVSTPRVEWFYWITITFSQTLGTALGDWVAAPPGDIPPGMGFGYEIGALIFGSALAIIAALYFWTRISHVLLFWAAFILTRPLGATIGDFFDKPVDKGGLDVSRPLASAILAAVILACIFIFPQRAGLHPGGAKP
ncbi:MAG TPA: hypothetical protein VIM02_14280 [Rhizomicrobium sp.]|jgi:uncharacterized membrane-anchored protein